MQLEQLDLRELLRKSPAEVRDSLMRAEIHFVTVHLQSSFPGWSRFRELGCQLQGL